MKVRPPGVLLTFHRAFARYPLRDRLHLVARAVTCPFGRALDHLPPQARLLDIGGGHGHVAVLALARGAREVTVVEPDSRKLFHRHRPRGVRFVNGFDDALRGRFDAISMFDVLYKIPHAQWDGLLARIHGRLAPGGVFLLKELDPERRVRQWWNHAQERVATAVGLTIGEAFAYESRAEMARRLEGAGFSAIRVVDLAGAYPHAHILYVARRGEDR